MVLKGIEELTLLQKFFYFCCLFTFTVSLLIYAKVRQLKQKKKKGPLKTQQIKEIQSLPYRERFERDGFLPKKIPDDLDYIIVGSGMSGLSSAALLSRFGYKCLVLEQHDRAGGCLHVFDDKGYEFDTGIHYVGKVTKAKRVLDKLAHPEYPIDFTKLGTEENGFCFDKIYSGDHLYFEMNENFIEDLKKKFPNDTEAIEKYEKAMLFSGPFSNFWGALKIFNNFFCRWCFKFLLWMYPEYTMTYGDFLDSITDNVQLKQVLCGNFGDAGLLPSQTAAFLILNIHAHYEREGGFYPNGGPEKIVKSLIPGIERAGGRVLVKAQVDEIVIANGTCMGVKVSRKSTRKTESIMISSKYGVISTVGHPNTRRLTHNLIPDFKMKYRTHSPCHLSMFLGFEGTAEELNVGSENLWVMSHTKPDQEYEDAVKDWLEGDEFREKFGRGFIGFPTAKDPEYNDRCPGKTIAVCCTELAWERVEEWKNDKLGKREQAYIDYKNQLAKHVLESVFWPYYPHLKEKLAYMEVGTPLTTSYYYQSNEGACYGLNFGVERVTQTHKLAFRTNINKLYMAGQDIITGGFAGALASAKLLVGELLGYWDISCLLAGRSLEDDLDHMAPFTLRDFETPYTAKMAEIMKEENKGKKRS